MRIAHVWSSDMGLSLSLPYLTPLVARGWEVWGICPPGPRVERVERAGVRWLPHSLTRGLDPAGDVAGARLLYAYFREHGFDIVHSHNAKAGLVSRLAAAAARVPAVLHTHHGMVFSLESPAAVRYGIAGLERIANVGVDRVLVQSSEDLETLVASGAIPRRLLQLIGNGIDLSRFDADRFNPAARGALRAELGVAPDDVLFLSAGRVVKEKGFLELFDAHARARAVNPRVRLLVAGPADVERGLGVSEEALDAARAAGVLLVGERDDMPNLYAAADVVVLASWREGLPRVLIEGAAMGLPLVATDARGCREVLTDDAWGLRVPVRDARALETALVKLAGDPALRARVGAHNRAAARERFDLDRVRATLDGIYEDILAAKRGRRPQSGAR